MFPKFQLGVRYADRTASSAYGDRNASLASLRDPISMVSGVSDGAVIDPDFHNDDAQQ